MKKIINYILESKFKFTVYLMVGIPGSGKSTWCHENHPDLEVVSRDKIRVKLGYTKNVDEKAKLSWKEENLVTIEEYKQIKNLANKNQDFIIDDINTSKYRKDMIKTLHEYGAKVVGINMNTPLKTCIERRKGQIDADIMKQIWDKKVPLKKEEVDEIIEVPDNTKNG